MLKVKHMAAYRKRYADFFLSTDARNGRCTLTKFENWVNRMTGPNGIPFKDEDARNKFKGDALEVLAEMFFLAFPKDPKVGLSGYTPVALDEDYGVDATGINVNGDKVAVQVKYRSNPGDPATFPTYAEIARTFTSGVCQLGVDASKDSVVFVFTNANQLGSNCGKVLGAKLVSIPRDTLEHFMGNNRSFWRMAAQEVLAYFQYHMKGKVV